MEIKMKSKKLVLFGFIILVIATFSTQSHASGGVYGNIGIYEYPWNISIGYNDYRHGYRKPHYVEHHHYYHKPRRHHHRKSHHKGHGHYKRHHYRGHYSDYRPRHNFGHSYCRH